MNLLLGTSGEGRVKVVCLQENLAHGLGIAGRGVSTRGSLPILGNVLLRTDSGRLRLTATNLEVGINCWVPAKVEDDGAITVPAKLFIDFVNSLDLTPYEEQFESPRALVGWLAERDLIAPGARASQAELAEAVGVREALRDLLGAQNGLPADISAATAVIDAAAQRARLGVRFADGATRVEPAASGVRGAVGPHSRRGIRRDGRRHLVASEGMSR